MTRPSLPVVLGCLLLAVPGARAGAQAGYPNVDRPMALAEGDTIRLLNRIVVDRAPGQRGARIDVHFATPVPVSDAAGRARQADRLAEILAPEASRAGARKLTISICDTRACAETREPPRAWFIYERGIGGVWQRSRGS